MTTTVDTRVTPSLHPDNVKEIDGYDSETEVLLAPIVTTFDEAYRAVAKVHDAREAAKQNPTLNEASQIIITDDFARKHLERITRKFDAERANLVRGIESIERELSSPVQSRAAAPVAAEIRAHVKALPTSKLHTFLGEAMASGDQETLTAVLGAPPYLSGLTPEFRAIYLRQYHERNNPTLAKRLKAMVGAKALIEERAGLVFKEFEKAAGAPPHKARQLRDAKTAAERAFVMDQA